MDSHIKGSSLWALIKIDNGVEIKLSIIAKKNNKKDFGSKTFSSMKGKNSSKE